MGRAALRNAGWIIFAAALISRVALILALPRTSETFYDEPGLVALSLSESGHFANPYSAPTGPTAHVAPLMPVILAFFLKIFGDVNRAWLASRFLQALVLALFAGLLPSLAERFGLGRRAGIVAGIVAAFPTFLWVETNGKFETAFTLLATTLLVAFTSYRLTHNQLFGTTRSWALTGAAWGVGVLIAPTLLPVLLALVAYGLLSRGENSRLSRVQAIATLGAAVVVFGPYSIERSFTLHAPVLVRSNFGLELFLSNNDRAAPRFLDNMAAGRVMNQFHPLARRREAVRVGTMGEGPYNTMLQRQAVAWIVAHPARFANLTILRAKEFWFPTSNSSVKTAFLWSVAIAGVAWLVAQARGRDPDRATLARLWLVAISAYSVVHYVIQADVRYRYPVQGLLLLAAAAGAVELFQRRSGPPQQVHVRQVSSAEQPTTRVPVERPEPVPVHAERPLRDSNARDAKQPRRERTSRPLA